MAVKSGLRPWFEGGRVGPLRAHDPVSGLNQSQVDSGDSNEVTILWQRPGEALYCFLSSPDSFEQIIEHAVFLGGDTDTIANMAGALSGAWLGDKALPTRWWAGNSGLSAADPPVGDGVQSLLAYRSAIKLSCRK